MVWLQWMVNAHFTSFRRRYGGKGSLCQIPDVEVKREENDWWSVINPYCRLTSRYRMCFGMGRCNRPLALLRLKDLTSNNSQMQNSIDEFLLMITFSLLTTDLVYVVICVVETFTEKSSNLARAYSWRRFFLALSCKLQFSDWSWSKFRRFDPSRRIRYL